MNWIFSRSERVGKTGVGGILLKEAKYINLSLHFLEQVKNFILLILINLQYCLYFPFQKDFLPSVIFFIFSHNFVGDHCIVRENS